MTPERRGQLEEQEAETSLMDVPAPARIRPGIRLGPYQLDALIGEGGMGQVFRARDTRLGRPVAIKVIHGETRQRPDFQLRFLREAQTTAALNHPHICTLYDVGEQKHAGGSREAFRRAETLVRELAGNISDPAARKGFLEMNAVREVLAGAAG